MELKNRYKLLYIVLFAVLVISSILVTIALNNQDSVNPEQGQASVNSAPKFIAASLCSGFTSSDPAELARRDRELVNVDGIHCRKLWNDIQTGPGTYNYGELGTWIRQNDDHGKKSVIGIMTRSDYKDDCNVAYQSMPKFMLNDSSYDPIPGNSNTASWGDNSGESDCARGTMFEWDITYKQVNYLNNNVKNEIAGMVNGFAEYLRNTELNPGSGDGLKLIDAMGGIEIAVGHQGEPRPVWTNRGAKSTPSQGVPSGQWQTCPSSGYNANTPDLYSDWCHFVWKWGNGDPYSAASNWVAWQTWLVQTYKNAFGSELPMYLDTTGSLATNGENAGAIEVAASLGIGSKSTGISPNQGPGSGVEYRNGLFAYNNWWNVLRKHWDDALKPPMAVEHGTSVIPVFNSIGNQKHPNLFYWMVLAGLSYHTDQFHLLSSMIQPSFDTNTGFVTGLNDEFLTWAKPYTGADRENSPGAFTVLRENALLENKVTDWFSNSETRTKWQAGTDSGCYYCDRGFGPSLDNTTFNTSTAYGGNYDFFMSSDNGRGEQNIPGWNYNGNYSPVNGRPDPNFPKEGMFYRRTDRATNRNEFCFDVEDRFRSIRGGSGNYTVVVKYKNDSVVFELAHKNTVMSQITGTGDGTWKSTTFNLTNATFNNDFISAGGRNYDFCIRRVSGSDLSIHMVEVKPEGSGSTPPPNQAPVVDAGSDQTITLPSNASLVGTATDDGLPNPPAILTKTWSKVSGAGTVTFSAVNNLNTTASFGTAGVYTLRLTVADSALTTTDDVVITVNSEPPTGTVANPTFSPTAGIYTSAQTVTISSLTNGAAIRYTTNGTDPTITSGTLYSGAITISSTTTLKAIAYKDGMNPSSVSSALYTINIPPSQVVAPTFNPTGGTYTTTQSVTITTTTSGSTIKYTTNGTDPTPTSGTLYSGAITISSTTTLKAMAYKSGMNDSSVTTAIYTINPPPQTGTVATPIINPNGGTFTSAQSVTIATMTEGASIRYTTNGTDPTESSSLYTIPLTISSTTTLKAKAFKTGMNASSIASAVFTINPPQGVTEYSVVGTISYRYDNIPVTVNIKNGSTVVKTLTINSITSDNRIEFRLNSSEVGVGNYTVVIKPRYYTAREGNLTLGANQNVTFTVAGEYYAGKYTTSNPDKITILDVSRFLAYFRAGDHSKDLNGDQRINILDIVHLLNGYRATL